MLPDVSMMQEIWHVYPSKRSTESQWAVLCVFTSSGREPTSHDRPSLATLRLMVTAYSSRQPHRPQSVSTALVILHAALVTDESYLSHGHTGRAWSTRRVSSSQRALGDVCMRSTSPWHSLS